MNIRTTTEGFDLTEAISNYADKKIASLGKHLKGMGDETTIDVILRKDTKVKKGQGFEAEINVRNGKEKVINAQASDSDLYAAIDKVKDDIVAELVKKSTRTRTNSRKDAGKVKRQIKGL